MSVENGAGLLRVISGGYCHLKECIGMVRFTRRYLAVGSVGTQCIRYATNMHRTRTEHAYKSARGASVRS